MTKILYYLMIRSSILKALSDGIEEIAAIHAETQIEMNILLATLLELELTGTLENIGGQIYRLAAELDITVHLFKQKTRWNRIFMSSATIKSRRYF